MQQLFEKVTFLTGDAEAMTRVATTPARPVFDGRVLEFLSDLSRILLRDPRVKAKDYEDIIGYAYWIRKASLERMKQTTYHSLVGKKLGRGVSFHIAPSNVPINFAVTFTGALLAGNVAIVRVSNKQFEQVDILADAIRRLFSEGYEDLRDYLILVRYQHSEEITQAFSSLCDVRVIWGGDTTIRTVRRAQLPTRAIELTFADRYSVAIIRASAVTEETAEKLARAFYNDTYYIGQNACYSPRIVLWLGAETETAVAQELFWSELGEIVHKEYPLEQIQTVDKLNMLYLAAQMGGVHLQSGTDMYAVRLSLDELTPTVMDYKLSGGFFYEYRMETMEEAGVLFEKPCQTVTTFGVERQEVLDVVLRRGARGVDRIVPAGGAMEANLRWDGLDMVEMMSRYIM